MNSYILVAAAASVQLNNLNNGAANGQPANGQPPARLPRRLEGHPACCVEHSYWADGEVTGTTCSGGRSPWDASTMSDLCTAGYSDAGEWAPPFRDCSQAAIDADAGCGTADWETCAQCAEYGIPTGMFFANVGYASCPDWVVDAMNAEAEDGGQCAEGLGGVWTCPTCDGWCSCEDCAGPVNSCDWDCDESRSEPTWGGTKEDCGSDDDDDDDDDSVGKIIGPIVAGVVIVTAAFGPWVYCHMRKKAAAAPPPMVEAQVLEVVSETSSTEVQVLGTVVSETSSAAATAWASEGTVESVPSAPPAEEMPAAAPLRNWEMPPPAPPRNFCSACGAPVQGPFCGQCGARA